MDLPPQSELEALSSGLEDNGDSVTVKSDAITRHQHEDRETPSGGPQACIGTNEVIVVEGQGEGGEEVGAEYVAMEPGEVPEGGGGRQEGRNEEGRIVKNGVDSERSNRVSSCEGGVEATALLSEEEEEAREGDHMAMAGRGRKRRRRSSL